VCTVCTTTLLGSLVDLNVLDDEVRGVETLSVGIGLCVFEKREEELCALDGPAGLGDAKLLAYCFWQKRVSFCFCFVSVFLVPSVLLFNSSHIF